MTNVTAISDFLILQTSTGDQSVMYFDKISNNALTTAALTVPTSSFATMWTNNSNSAANWSEYAIKIGSYNGNYGSPANKYSGSSTGTVATIFDGAYAAGLNRTARPSSNFRLMS